MNSWRTIVSSIIIFSICCAPKLSRAAEVATATTAGSLSIASATYGVVQNVPTRTVVVNRTGGSSGAATVLCKTYDNTAHSGEHYTAVSTTLSWASGDATPKTCSVPIKDAVPFHGTKTFYVGISAATGAALGSPLMSTVLIYGNLGGGTVSLSSPTYSVAQSAGSVTITVNRTNGSVGEACVFYATANATAVAGTNYTAKSGILSWANADTAPKSFSIPISTASSLAGNKTLAVAIAGAENVMLGSPASAIVTITPWYPGLATLSWTKPTSNTDGSPLTNLQGYKIYFGTSLTEMNRVIEIGSPSTVAWEIGNLSSATWYFAVLAYNTDGVESALSPVESKAI